MGIHKTVQLGFMAPNMKQQFPEMDDAEAYNFDQDNLTMHRLKVRGILTESDMGKARKRLLKMIAREINNV